MIQPSSPERDAPPGPSSPSLVRKGRLTLFGHDPTPARVEVITRSRRWRTVRAARMAGAGLLIAPLVGLVPPHAPWALGAAVGGAFLARRRWQERHTLESLEAVCPRCGAELRESPHTRLRHPHPVACEACHHEAALVVEMDETDSSG